MHRFSYSSVERTLCPLLNAGAATADIMVDLSTSSPTNLNLTLRASLVQNYSLRCVTVATAAPVQCICTLLPSHHILP